jgi:hypothetical protein
MDEALNKAGGFGLYQIFTQMIFCFAFWAGGFIIYTIGFMTVLPKYSCLYPDSTEYVNCG